MKTEISKTEKTEMPIIAMETDKPDTSIPAVKIVGEKKTDGRNGGKKIVAVDGTVSYGLKKDGTPRKAPGRKPKAQ